MFGGALIWKSLSPHPWIEGELGAARRPPTWMQRTTGVGLSDLACEVQHLAFVSAVFHGGGGGGDFAGGFLVLCRQRQADAQQHETGEQESIHNQSPGRGRRRAGSWLV